MGMLSVTGTVPVDSSGMSHAIDLLVETTSREVVQKAAEQSLSVFDYYPPIITVTLLPKRDDDVEEWFTVTVTTVIRTPLF